MELNCCSFASQSFYEIQLKQEKCFLDVGFKTDEIHLYNPNKLGSDFYKTFSQASEKNKYGWFSFKPYFILLILNQLNNNDILFYLDVNDKPLFGIKEYIFNSFLKNKKIDLIVPSTNYPNFKFLSSFHKSNLSLELLTSSFINFQPEAGALLVRNSSRSRSIIKAWYELTLLHAYELEKYKELKTRWDQETLFLLSRIYKSIKLESWISYKLTGKGIRKYIEFESFRE